MTPLDFRSQVLQGLRTFSNQLSKANFMSNLSQFKGSITALVTPMDEHGKCDETAFRSHVKWQIEQGTHGLVPMGTTGESPTMTHEEHKAVVEWCIDEAKGAVPIIAGAGSNSTDEAIEFSLHAQKAGASALLHVTPYYNKPNQEGLYQHFAAIAKATKLPIFIYNIPPRSVVDMSVETMARLSNDFENIVGVKDATGNLLRPSLQRAACGADFIQLSGEDGTALGFNAHGGVGCISVASNVAPKLCSQFQIATLNGDYATALTLQDKLMPLHTALFLEPNPVPAKYALSLIRGIKQNVRLPLVTLSEGTKIAIQAALKHAGLI